MNDKQYINPPNHKKGVFSKISGLMKDINGNLDRDYRRSLLLQQIILIPILFFTNILIFALVLPLSIGLNQYYDNGILETVIGIIMFLIIISLTVIAIIFYPYSVYWYTNSSFYKFFEDIYLFGGFFQVVFKKLLMVLGHILIAGLLSPIVGIMTWRKLKRQNIIIVHSNKS